ncbi:MAG: radical SAM protein [Candidatus Nitrohelix vancouverensis]|uniref:Radical SAM protein n=1 Tax=Candidatus Nitrohelix vancouverensis TaxID=2705534 RepID=A0A7T0C2I6_9BACT|nr:MAG: radical SAM protein [Candidatus Nitrohelix vancouverensis]
MKKNLDLLLVTPPSKDQVFQKLGENLTGIEPPVWSTLMATFVRNSGFSTHILDAEAECIGFDETAKRILDIDAVLTVFVIYGHQPSASTQCMPAGRAVCDRVVAANAELKTLVMGTHASSLPERTLSEEPYTYVCQGEGPDTVLNLLQALKAGSDRLDKIPGLWYRKDGKIFNNPTAENIVDLDGRLPGQAWDLLDMTKYRAHNWHCFDHIHARQPYASLQTSLGCPYKCSFCCINAPFGQAGIRYWSPKTIVDQIDILVNRYGVKNIKIPDEMFVLNEQHVLGICDLIIERGYDLNIWAYARVDTVKDRYLEKLKRAGFNWLALGIESGSKYVRDGVEKGRFGDVDIVKTTDKIKEHGIYIIANYIFGLPDDTHESMQETLDLSIEINAEWANFYCAMAYPGSPLYERAVQSGWQLPDGPGGPGWIGYSQHAYEALPLRTDSLAYTEVLDFRDKAFDHYFTHPKFLEMINRRFSQELVDHIHDMVRVKIKRKHRSVSL